MQIIQILLYTTNVDVIASYKTFTIKKLSKELAEKFAEDIVAALDQIPMIEKHSVKEVLADTKGDRILYGKWEHSVIAFDSIGNFAGVVIGYERVSEGSEQYPENSIYLNEIAVSEQFQKQGLGSFLLKEWLAFNMRIGYKKLDGKLGFSVQTNKAEWNHYVQMLYESIGFKKIAEKQYPNRVDIVYFLQKNLLITIGNIYLDNNIFQVDTGGEKGLSVGKDYFAERSEKVLGGSAVNFAMQATCLGLSTAFLGRVGDDEEGQEVKSLLREKHINADLVETAAGEQTSIAFNAILSEGGEFIGFHWGSASRNLDADQIDINHPLFGLAAAVYFGGTAKQANVLNTFPALLQQIHEKGIKIFIDPNRFPVNEQNVKREFLLNSFQHVDCYLPNEEEIKQVVQDENLDKALDIVLRRGAKLIVVKMGSKGCRIKSKEKDFMIPGFKVSPLTTVGAGDTFNAGFVTQYLAGKPVEDCAKFANACAAIKVRDNKFAVLSEVENFLIKYKD